MRELSFAASPSLIRQALQAYQSWIEARLGCALADTVILRSDLAFSQLGFRLLGGSELLLPRDRTMDSLLAEIEDVSLPPGEPPIVGLIERTREEAAQLVEPSLERHPCVLSWISCPVAFKLHSLASALVALRVPRPANYFEPSELFDDILLGKRENAAEMAALLVRLTARERRPAMRTLREPLRPVAPCGWEELTLAPEIRMLLQDDFASFFRDKEWYERMRIPHRRGYLLHGPPGNGKTSAVRAMLTSQGLTAYQLRPFGKNTSDEDLQRVFDLAARRRPAMVLLEDIDRAFPRSGQMQSKVHLQTLLNCVDGIATEPGIVTVATANDPSLLDPAILRRPGRFDRVIHFGNPDAQLREEYLLRMHPPLAGEELAPAVVATEGFSYALLREAYILAAQAARSGSRDLDAHGLAAGAAVLQQGYRAAIRKGGAAGFVGAG